MLAGLAASIGSVAGSVEQRAHLVGGWGLAPGYSPPRRRRPAVA